MVQGNEKEGMIFPIFFNTSFPMRTDGKMSENERVKRQKMYRVTVSRTI